jgi:hypothetical protein
MSTGDMLRQHIADHSPIGRQAARIVAQGDLLPDDLMLKVVGSKLNKVANKVRRCAPASARRIKPNPSSPRTMCEISHLRASWDVLLFV